MKKKVCALMLALALFTSMTTMLASARWNSTEEYIMKITFSGTTANCVVNVNAYESTAIIDGTVKLMRGGATLATWPLTGSGSAAVTERMGCTSGQTYTLILDATVTGSNGTDNLYDYVSKTCP